MDYVPSNATTAPAMPPESFAAHEAQVWSQPEPSSLVPQNHLPQPTGGYQPMYETSHSVWNERPIMAFTPSHVSYVAGVADWSTTPAYQQSQDAWSLQPSPFPEVTRSVDVPGVLSSPSHPREFDQYGGPALPAAPSPQSSSSQDHGAPGVIVVETEETKSRRDGPRKGKSTTKRKQTENHPDRRTTPAPVPPAAPMPPAAPRRRPRRQSSVSATSESTGRHSLSVDVTTLSDVSSPEYPVPSDRDSGYGSAQPSPSLEWAKLGSSSRGSSLASRRSSSTHDRDVGKESDAPKGIRGRYPPNSSKNFGKGHSSRSHSRGRSSTTTYYSS